MSLHDDLLEQANQLATLDTRRPKQASLRRSVSASYYALFHLLSFESAQSFAKGFEFQARISRTLNHGDMKKVSALFANDKLPKSVQPPGGVGSFTIPADLKTVANTFVELQQARHEADYDLTRSFRRGEADNFYLKAKEAFAAWERVKRTDEARLYLACFLLWKRWDEEPR